VNTIDAVKEILLQSGASWVLWLLGALSLISITIMVERWLFYRSRAGNLEELAQKLDTRLAAGELRVAAEELERSPSIAATIAAAGLRLAERGPAAADKAMLSATALERGNLERWLAYLGTLGNNAPFIGLFGTVIGVIKAFEELGHGAPGHGTASAPAAAAQVASQAVMASIAEALVATAVGILVALPAVAAFNYFQRRIASLLSGTEVLSNLVLAYLSERDRAPNGGGGAQALSRSPAAETARDTMASLTPSAG
jgi:biopolymer transport protein ExbB